MSRVENLYTPGCIRTFSGRYFNPFEPNPDLIEIEDIAHALSMIPRFGGHLPVWYSVAEHCITGALNIQPEHRLWFLLHDATEGLGLLDLPKPIKDNLPDYKAAEDRLMKVIADKFKLSWPMPSAVKDMDRRMLEWEWENIMLTGRFRNTTLSQAVAKKQFLELYKFLNYEGTSEYPEPVDPRLYSAQAGEPGALQEQPEGT